MRSNPSRQHNQNPPRFASGLLLSALRIELREPEPHFLGSRSPYTGHEEFAALRQNHALFVWRDRDAPKDANLLTIRLTDLQTPDGPPPVALDVASNHAALAALLQQRMRFVLEELQLRAKRRRGLRRINRNDDLVAKTFARMDREVPQEIRALHKYARTEFHVRQLQLQGEDPSLVLAFELGRHFEIDGTARGLLAAGLDLSDVWMRDYDAPDGERDLGPVVGREGDCLLVSGVQGVRRVSLDRCWPQASTDTFTKLFERALPADVKREYDAIEVMLRAETTAGSGYLQQVRKLSNWFIGKDWLSIAPSVACKFSAIATLQLQSPDNEREHGHHAQAAQLAAVQYCFSSDRSLLHQFPSEGLDRYGPFDGRTFDKKSPRLLVVMPHDVRADVEVFLRRLLHGMEREGARRFARGLIGTYRLSNVILDHLPVKLPREGSADVGAAYVSALAGYFDPARAPDIALVVVRDGDAAQENGRDGVYLRAKSFLLGQGIPVQDVRLRTIRQRPSSLPYVLENIAVALYAKLGGSPWTVIPTMPLAEEIVIGMGVSQTGGRLESKQRFAGVTTVFRSDGTYILGAASRRCPLNEFPGILQDFVSSTLQRLARERSWQKGDLVRLIFHAHHPLKHTDIGALVQRAVDELGGDVAFETAFITIHKNHPFKLIDPNERGSERSVELAHGGFARRIVGTCVPNRGIVADIGFDRRLLCVSGPNMQRREGEPIPQPLLLELHPLSSYRDMDSIARQVYHFTGLSWRSMMPVGEPVTIFYSELIADLLGKLSTVDGWSDALLETRLRRSRWFL